MDVLLFANGVLNHGVVLERLLKSIESPRVICADGGALHARALGFSPHAIIGDLDSLAAPQVAAFESAGAEIIQHPPDKDETDLELALRYCQQIGATSIHILGALGGRVDQTIANIHLLMQAAFRDLSIVVVDGDQTIRLLRPGGHEIVGQPGDTISLIPLGASAEGITTEALQYPLRGETLRFGQARGISNVIVGTRPVVQFRCGLLLLVHTLGRA